MNAESSATNPHALEGDRRNLTDDWFAGILPNMDLRVPRVATYALQQSLWWATLFEADGIRLDTYLMVVRNYWPEWSRRMQAVRPGLLAVSEASANGPAEVAFFQFNATYVALREHDGQKAIVAINVGDKPAAPDLPAELAGTTDSPYGPARWAETPKDPTSTCPPSPPRSSGPRAAEPPPRPNPAGRADPGPKGDRRSDGRARESRVRPAEPGRDFGPRSL